MQRHVVCIDRQMRRAPQTSVEVVAPCVIGADDAAGKPSYHGAGFLKRHQLRSPVTADVVEGVEGTVIAGHYKYRLQV